MAKKETSKFHGRGREAGTKIEFHPIKKRDFQKLYVAAETDQDRLMLSMLVELGIRVSDFVKLEYNYLKTIIDSKGETKYFFEYTSTKTKKLVKGAISKETYDKLMKYKESKNEKKKRRESNRIFPYTTQWIRKMLLRLRNRAHLKRLIRPHDFCGTTMTLMREQGIPTKLIADQVGRKPRTVREHYQKFDQQAKAEAVEKSVSIKALLEDDN